MELKLYLTHTWLSLGPFARRLPRLRKSYCTTIPREKWTASYLSSKSVFSALWILEWRLTVCKNRKYYCLSGVSTALDTPLWRKRLGLNSLASNLTELENDGLSGGRPRSLAVEKAWKHTHTGDTYKAEAKAKGCYFCNNNKGNLASSVYQFKARCSHLSYVVPKYRE